VVFFKRVARVEKDSMRRHHFLRGWLCRSAATRLLLSAQGCEERATLVIVASSYPTPTGLYPCLHAAIPFQRLCAHRFFHERPIPVFVQRGCSRPSARIPRRNRSKTPLPARFGRRSRRSCPHAGSVGSKHFPIRSRSRTQAGFQSLVSRTLSGDSQIRLASRIRRFFRERFEFGKMSAPTSPTNPSTMPRYHFKMSSGHSLRNTAWPSTNGMCGTDATPMGLTLIFMRTQGSSFLATLG
jgi:hypothetical protein